MTTTRTGDVLVNETSSDGKRITFEDLYLSPVVLSGLMSAGYVHPSPVQLQVIPSAKFGVDLIAQAKSGTGKTCVFAVVLLEQMQTSPTQHCQSLVIAPTREIACQIDDVIRDIGRDCEGLDTCVCIGGIPLSENVGKLAQEIDEEVVHVVIGTPGRLRQLVENNVLPTHRIRLAVLDEADKLVDDEFWTVVNYIMESLPERKQVLAFSATYGPRVKSRLALFMRAPQVFQMNDLQGNDDRPLPTPPKPAFSSAVLLGVSHFLLDIDVDEGDRETGMGAPNEDLLLGGGSDSAYGFELYTAFDRKCKFVLDILRTVPFHQCIVFYNQRSRAEALVERLNQAGLPANFIAGDLPQTRRNLVIKSMRNIEIKVLVSTDLIARGVDIPNVKLVLCLDMPYDTETMMHRAGRTGRFGTRGAVVSVLTSAEVLRLRAIAKDSGISLRPFTVDLFGRAVLVNEQCEDVRPGARAVEAERREEVGENHGEEENTGTEAVEMRGVRLGGVEESVDLGGGQDSVNQEESRQKGVVDDEPGLEHAKQGGIQADDAHGEARHTELQVQPNKVQQQHSAIVEHALSTQDSRRVSPNPLVSRNATSKAENDVATKDATVPRRPNTRQHTTDNYSKWLKQCSSVPVIKYSSQNFEQTMREYLKSKPGSQTRAPPRTIQSKDNFTEAAAYVGWLKDSSRDEVSPPKKPWSE